MNIIKDRFVSNQSKLYVDMNGSLALLYIPEPCYRLSFSDFLQSFVSYWN